MRIKNSDLIAAISIAALNMVWTQIPHRPLLVGIIFALPLTFILPGYTLTQVLTTQARYLIKHLMLIVPRPNQV